MESLFDLIKHMRQGGKSQLQISRSRWKNRSVRPLSRKKIWFITLLLVLFIGIQTFVYVERNLKPNLLSLASFRVHQIATETINSAITNRIANSVNFENLVDWHLNHNGDVTGFTLNYAQHLKIASETVEHVEELLHNISEIQQDIPLGLAMGSTLFASHGPSIPIKFVPIGHAKVDLKTRETDAGINMLLVEVYLKIHAEVMIYIPFDTKPEVLTTEVPLSYMLVVGDVPMYYFNHKGQPTSISGVGITNIALPELPAGASAEPSLSSPDLSAQ